MTQSDVGNSKDSGHKLSVIIPTMNSEKHITDCLSSLFKQSFRDFEVIIVDGHSKDKTVELACKFPVKIFTESFGTRGGACNVGAENADSKILVFTDDDCRFPADWLEKIAKYFDNNKNLVALGGLDRIVETDVAIGKSRGLLDISLRRSIESGYGAVFRIKGCDSSYRADVFRRLGGFDPSLKYWEEAEFHSRLLLFGRNKQFVLLYDPDVYLFHFRHAESPFRTRVIMRRGVPMFLRRHVIKTGLKARYSAIFTTYVLSIGTFVFLTTLGLTALFFPLYFVTVIVAEIGLSLLGLLSYGFLVIGRVKNESTLQDVARIPAFILFESGLKLVGLFQGFIDVVNLRLSKLKK